MTTRVISITVLAALLALSAQPGNALQARLLPPPVVHDAQPVSPIALQGKTAATPSGVSSSALFLPGVPYDSGAPNATSIAVADVNGDGHPDLLVTSAASESNGDGSVSVLLGSGDGTFQPAVIYDSGGENTSSVAIADVNGDGLLDLILASECPAGGCHYGSEGVVGVLFGNGDGSFQPAITYDSGGQLAVSVAVADLNGDGKPDIAVANRNSNMVNILLNKGDGTFRRLSEFGLGYCGYGLLCGAPDFVVLADMNGDGRPDLVMGLSAYFFSAVEVQFGRGDGTFYLGPGYYAGGGGSTAVAVGDVNGDGIPDLLVANSGCQLEVTNCGQNTIGVLLGTPLGTYQPVVVYNSGASYPTSIAVADVNGDGKLDLLIANTSGGTGEDGSIAVLLGNGDGTFQPPLLYDSAGDHPSSLAVADVNGDGRPDVLVANLEGAGGPTYEGSVGVLLNNTGSSTPTTTTLVSSLNPSTFGQTVTFTAAVTSANETPTGTLLFLNGPTLLATDTLANGSASLTMPTLGAASYSIAAGYQGSGGLGYSTFALKQVVNTATTTTSLSSSANPGVRNEVITYTVTVISQYGGALTGNVTLRDNGRAVETCGLSGIQALCTFAYSSTGVHSITATYSGDANNVGSASSTLMEIIGPLKTETAVTTSGTPSLVGRPVTFTAAVTSTYGAIPNGEIVTFYNGKTVLGSAALTGGLASFTTSSLADVTQTIKATYAGDATFGSSFGTVQEVVLGYQTSTALVSSLTPSTFGQKVTWTATVATSGPAAPTGTVNFNWSDFSIGSATLNSSGVATLTRSGLSADLYPLTAVYKGDASNASSASPILNQVINQTTSAAALTSSPNPSTQGESVTFTAKITSPTTTPSGPVTFTAGKTTLATVELTNGKATFTTSTLAVGSTTVTVTYPWNSDISNSSASVTQVVQSNGGEQ
jgi:hypothetical protein